MYSYLSLVCLARSCLRRWSSQLNYLVNYLLNLASPTAVYLTLFLLLAFVAFAFVSFVWYFAISKGFVRFLGVNKEIFSTVLNLCLLFIFLSSTSFFSSMHTDKFIPLMFCVRYLTSFLISNIFDIFGLLD